MPARRPVTAKTTAVETARRNIVLRLKRAEGQLRAVQRMVEQGEDCEPIAQQLAAARKALDKVFFELIACAIEHRGFSRIPADDDNSRVRRLTRTLARLA